MAKTYKLRDLVNAHVAGGMIHLQWKTNSDLPGSKVALRPEAIDLYSTLRNGGCKVMCRGGDSLVVTASYDDITAALHFLVKDKASISDMGLAYDPCPDGEELQARAIEESEIALRLQKAHEFYQPQPKEAGASIMERAQAYVTGDHNNVEIDVADPLPDDEIPF